MRGSGLLALKAPPVPPRAGPRGLTDGAQWGSVGLSRLGGIFLEEDSHPPACRLNLPSVRPWPETVTRPSLFAIPARFLEKRPVAKRGPKPRCGEGPRAGRFSVSPPPKHTLR